VAGRRPTDDWFILPRVIALWRVILCSLGQARANCGLPFLTYIPRIGGPACGPACGTDVSKVSQYSLLAIVQLAATKLAA